MDNYLIERDGEYINIYKNDELYQQGKLPRSISKEEQEKIINSIKRYYTHKDDLMEYIDKNYEEAVNHPNHYQGNKYEVIDVIEDLDLNFNLGNSFKYIARAGKKNPEKQIEDLGKASWYINREIQRLKNER